MPPRRDQAFSLLKKRTSFTHLAQAAQHYRAFLDGFAALLNNLDLVHPQPNLQRSFDIQRANGTYQEHYANFLKALATIEQGLDLLRITADKKEAYRHFRRDQLRDDLGGRGADFLGIEHDPFFITLGMGGGQSPDLKNETTPALIAGAMGHFYKGAQCFSQLDQILLEYSSTSYEYLLNDAEYAPTAGKPALVPPCPQRNSDPACQVWSDRVIPLTGIWEPWLCEEGLFSGIWARLCDRNTAKLTGRVGCPNYFLAGTKAYNYRREDRKHIAERVAWRLLWQDERYLDGNLPEEEMHSLHTNTSTGNN